MSGCGDCGRSCVKTGAGLLVVYGLRQCIRMVLSRIFDASDLVHTSEFYHKIFEGKEAMPRCPMLGETASRAGWSLD